MTTHSKHGENAAPITRSLVLENVLDTGEGDDHASTDGFDSLRSCQNLHSSLESSHHHVEDNNTLPLGATLKELRAWLDVQCEEEQARADWNHEYERQVEDHTREDDANSKGLNTHILSRIKNGHGPRSSKFEDLLWPLRMDGTAPRFDKKPRKETRQEMEEVLQNWNKHVGVPIEDSKAREALIEAMYVRIDLLDRASHRSSADVHDETSRKLVHAIWAYRLETVNFQSQDTCNLMTIVLGHLGYAIPNIDQELKYLMFYTLVAERQYLANIANASTTRKLERNIAEAKLRGDADNVGKYERQMNHWGLAIWQNNCGVIADRVKTARRNVELQGLKELQELTVLQTAQKIALQERISRGDPLSNLYIPRSTWLPEYVVACDAATTALTQSANKNLSDILASLKIATRNIDTMEDITHARILTRAIKFAGLDLKELSEAEKKRVVKVRMVHPSTVNMMRDAYQAMKETKEKGRETVVVVGDMDGKLEKVLRQVEAANKEHAELARLVEGDPMMVPGIDTDGKLEWEDVLVD